MTNPYERALVSTTMRAGLELLIGGNHHVFHEGLLQDGAPCGATAASKLEMAVREAYPGCLNLAVTIHVDLKEMVAYHCSAGVDQQELQYWMLYTPLRPDRNIRLVSSPYQVKYTTVDSSCVLRHVDLNVQRHLEEGRGGNIIQGSVSLDDEALEGGCTAIMPGFYAFRRVLASSFADWLLPLSEPVFPKVFCYKRPPFESLCPQ